MQGGAKSLTRMGIYGSVKMWSSEDIKDSDDVPSSIGFFNSVFRLYAKSKKYIWLWYSLTILVKCDNMTYHLEKS